LADSEIKQVIIRNQNLPLVQFTKVYDAIQDREIIDKLYYGFRYRIVSEDRNRFSEWSTIKTIIAPDITDMFPYTGENRFSINVGGNPVTINAIWSFPGDSEFPSEYEKVYRNIRTYDIWLRWNNNNTTDLNDPGWTEWEYETNVAANNFSILKKDNEVKRIEIAVQAPSSEKIRDYNNNKLTLFRGISGTI